MNQRVMVSASAVALVALVAGGVALAERNGGSHTPAQIEVQSLGSAGAEAKLATSSPAASSMAPIQNLTFVLEGDLPVLDGDRPAWHLAVNPTADLGTIAALAKSLGLDGEVKSVENAWQVGDPQNGPILFVNQAPGLPWNYSNFAMQVGYSCASSSGTPPGGDTVPTTSAPPPPTCDAPPPPVGVPTKDEALAKVSELLKSLGIDAGSLTITANASEWSADVQAVPTLDGVAVPSLTTSFGFGAEGKLQYANGFLLAAEKADSYPRIGTAKAFEALKSGKGFSGWFGFGGGPMAKNALGYGGPVTTVIVSDNASSSGASCVAIGTPPAGDVSPATTVPCPPMTCLSPLPPTTAAVDQKGMSPDGLTCGPAFPEPCRGVAVSSIAEASTAVVPSTAPAPMDAPGCVGPDPVPPEPVTITITGVHETLLPLMGADGSMWLVPGYEFTSADNGTWPVLAIDQSFVDQVAPIQPTPQTMTAVTAAGGPTTTAGG